MKRLRIKKVHPLKIGSQNLTKKSGFIFEQIKSISLSVFGMVVGGLFFSAVLTNAYTQQSLNVSAGDLLSASGWNKLVSDIGSLLGAIDINGTGAYSRYDVNNSASSNELITAKWAKANLGGVSLFGDGSDGDVTITTSVTLSRDMYYNNLSIDPTGILNPNGYKIYVKGTLSGNGIIRRNGNNGSNATCNSWCTTSAPGGLALNQGSLNADLGGGAGGLCGNGGAGANANPSYTTINGVTGGCGDVGNCASNTASAGIATRGGSYNTVNNLNSIIGLLLNPASSSNVNMPSTQYKGPAGSSGGGARCSSSQRGAGGGAGGNGGVIRVSANTINYSGIWESRGGNGGNGGSFDGGSTGKGGGGGGGQGGVVYVIYKTISSFGTTNLAGGTGGGGVGGSNGTSGNSGVVIQIPVN